MASSPYLGEVELIILSWLFQPHCSKREASLKITNHPVIFNEIQNIGLIHHIISYYIISYHITSHHIIYIFYMLILHTSSHGMYWDISMILFKSNSVSRFFVALPTSSGRSCSAHDMPSMRSDSAWAWHLAMPIFRWHGMTWHISWHCLPDICLSEGYLLIWVPICFFCINQQLWTCLDMFGYVSMSEIPNIPIALAKNFSFLAVFCLVSCRLVCPDLLQRGLLGTTITSSIVILTITLIGNNINIVAKQFIVIIIGNKCYCCWL